MKSLSAAIFFDKQSKEHAKIMYYVREIIIESHPAIYESIKYGTPFYTLKKNVCYLTHSKKDGVYIGFINGKNLSNIQETLISDGRKQVRILKFSSLEVAIKKEALLKEILNEAFILDTI